MTRTFSQTAFLLITMGVMTCTVGASSSVTDFSERIGLPTTHETPATPELRAAIELGRRLFLDERFSADGKVSCGTCHKASLAFSDGLPQSKGFEDRVGSRNAPSLLNVVFQKTLFWDGRRVTLEDQALDPLTNPLEHGLTTLDDVLRIVRSDTQYVHAMQQAFGVRVPNEITSKEVAKALASFQRTLIAGNAPFDRYLYGGDAAALTPSAQRGLALFRGAARCSVCHAAGDNFALFTDDQFHSLGVGFKSLEKRLAALATEVVQLPPSARDRAVLTRPEVAELGRFVVTGIPSDIGKFKTPSLRNVALTAPYMHDGSVATLEEAVDLEIYYRSLESGRPLILTPAERADLVEFLKSLTSDSTSTLRMQGPDSSGIR